MYVLYCDHQLLSLIIGSASYWADCLSHYIKKQQNIYILNVKLGMPVFYSFKVVSYLLVLKTEEMGLSV